MPEVEQNLESTCSYQMVCIFDFSLEECIRTERRLTAPHNNFNILLFSKLLNINKNNIQILVCSQLFKYCDNKKVFENRYLFQNFNTKTCCLFFY